jgi:hypothetical protein
VPTPRTFLLAVFQGSGLPHNNAHFENHPWFYFTGKFGMANGVGTIRTYHLIIASLDKAISDTILAIAIDDVVKILSPEISALLKSCVI